MINGGIHQDHADLRRACPDHRNLLVHRRHLKRYGKQIDKHCNVEKKILDSDARRALAPEHINT